ncbi:hypothetical protein FGO68_gene13000 [Halteria grandinella]|uniref:Uncharacterized protein n=1 Tax=Halteria grandinella TaxID=5974 RepID=A0A8J8NRR5_HALGN|nr:hypothetical protein FGO68_gene13000 [Halteria grandinella]
MCILKEFSKSLKKVYIKGPKLNIRGLQYILKDLPPSVSQIGLKFLYFDREIATTKYNIKKLKLEDMYNSQLPNILSLFTVTEKLKLNQSFLYDSNIVKYLNQIDTKEIVINVDIEKLPRIKNIFSALIRNNVFIRCSSSNYTKDIDWAFSHMKPKQLNKLWQISHVPYFDRNPSIIFPGAMGKCKRKQVNWTNSFSFDLENIQIQPDNVTQELNLYGENVITLAKLALKYCLRLRKLEICLAKKQIYIWKLIDIQTTWLEEINILNSSVNDHNFVDQLISKNQETLRCLRLNQCVGFDLSIIKHFKILTNLIIVNCQNLSNRETIATLTNLEALDTDDEVILQTARANNIIYRRGGFQKVIW